MQYHKNQQEFPSISRPVSPYITITVLTSKNCIFCDTALERVKEVVKVLNKQGMDIKVEESDVDRYPEIVSKLGVLSLPTTIIGNSFVSGVLSTHDLASHIQTYIFLGQ